jgi:NAD(P)-dependent dehydrogenase (short-subunit alcohol dehydrogenase family)
MSELLANRSAIVTGGARGVGFAIAQVLALHGARVMIVDNGCALDGGAEDSAVCGLAAERIGGLALAKSVADSGVPQEAVALAVQQFGAVDILVNSAVIARPAPVHSVREDDLMQVLGTNLSAAIAMMRAAAVHMRTQVDGGRLPGTMINLLGAQGLFGQRGDIALAAAKAGLLGATRAAALDLREHHITCNALVPFANTRSASVMNPQSSAEQRYRDLNQQLPVAPIANVVAWLASSIAARVSGQVFGVRGRELFLFSQTAPIERVFLSAGVLDADETSDLMLNTLGPLFTPLHTEADVFNSEPIV